MKLGDNEMTFEINPIGVNYLCEFCHDGFMMVDKNSKIEGTTETPLYPHVCRNCGKKLLLPKIYPYVHWRSEFDDD